MRRRGPRAESPRGKGRTWQGRRSCPGPCRGRVRPGGPRSWPLRHAEGRRRCCGAGTQPLRRRVRQLSWRAGQRHRPGCESRPIVGRPARSRWHRAWPVPQKRDIKPRAVLLSGSFTTAQIADLSHFLKQRVNDGLRGSPLFQPNNVLVGDAKAGAAYFAGGGKCSTCHSATGDLAGIGGRMSPIQLQQRFMFPGGGRGGRAGGEAPRQRSPPVEP